MRPIVIGAALTLILGLSWLAFVTLSPNPEVYIPADGWAVVEINQMPESVDFLERTRLSNLVDVDASAIQARISEVLSDDDLMVLRQSVDRAWVSLHGVDQKESGAYRPELSVVLSPHVLARKDLRSWIEQAVLSEFGEGADILQKDNLKIIRGPKEGQVLYLGEMEGVLLIANGERAWTSLELTANGSVNSLFENDSFEAIRSHLGDEFDLFLYVAGTEDGLIPRFGYAISLDGRQVADSYYEVPVN